MEYVFGIRERGGVIEDVLKTKGDVHTDLEGAVQLERVYDDARYYDSFKVIRKYKSKKDTEGNCYDWYLIADHFRYIDKYDQNITKITERIDGDIADATDGLMETYDLTASNSDDIADCRTALEELYEMMLEE